MNDREWCQIALVRTPRRRMLQVLTLGQFYIARLYYLDCWDRWDIAEMLGLSGRELALEIRALTKIIMVSLETDGTASPKPDAVPGWKRWGAARRKISSANVKRD